MVMLLIRFIRFYQKHAPRSIRGHCRFRPSCSQYSIEALEAYGVLKGVYLIVRRLNRCKPPNGGYDPVN